MQTSSKKAFTMIELIFVIVVIGILSAIAIPRFAATRDDAVITKARNTLASVRSAISIERQKRILRGDFTPITDLGTNAFPFYGFDGNNTNRVLEYRVRRCQGPVATARGCWTRGGGGSRYFYRMPHNNVNVRFNLTNNRLVCQSPNNVDCRLLSE